MAAGDLIFNGFTIAYAGTGNGASCSDLYNRNLMTTPKVDVQDYALANTAGQFSKAVGSQNTDASARWVGYSGILYCVTNAAMITRINAIENFMLNAGNLAGTLVDLRTTYTGPYRWVDFAYEPLSRGIGQTLGDGNIGFRFRATFKRLTG